MTRKHSNACFIIGLILLAALALFLKWQLFFGMLKDIPQVPAPANETQEIEPDAETPDSNRAIPAESPATTPNEN